MFSFWKHLNKLNKSGVVNNLIGGLIAEQIAQHKKYFAVLFLSKLGFGVVEFEQIQKDSIPSTTNIFKLFQVSSPPWGWGNVFIHCHILNALQSFWFMERIYE